MIHAELPWEGALVPQNKMLEPEATIRLRAAFKSGLPTGRPENPPSAANEMVQMAHKYPGQVSIYPAGALTDIALAICMDPQFASLAKHLVIIGGYVDLHLPADYQVRGESLCCCFVVSLV